jgi:hypothetical protein
MVTGGRNIMQYQYPKRPEIAHLQKDEIIQDLLIHEITRLRVENGMLRLELKELKQKENEFYSDISL